jgi:hypothetical protein
VRVSRIWWWVGGLLAAAAAALLVAGGNAGDRDAERRSAAREPVTANVWIAPTAGPSPSRCARPCTFDAARAYRSFDAAYAASHPGDQVRVKGGTYEGQLVNKSTANGKTLGSRRVTFRPADGETVRIANGGSFTNTANDVSYHDVELVQGAADDGSNGTSGGGVGHEAGRNVLYEGFVASFMGAAWTVDRATTDSPRNVTFRDMEIGPFWSCGGGSALVNSTAGPDNYTIEDSYFHDFTIREDCPAAHLDCLHTFNELEGVTIRRSRFENCFHFGVLVNGASNVLIENNFFDGAEVYGFKLRGDTDPDVEVFDDVRIHFNSGDRIDLGSRGSNTLEDVVVENNATTDGVTCRPEVAYGGNVSETAEACPGDHPPPGAGGLLFADPAAGDFHVGADSPVVGAAFGSSAPATDIDGEPRPGTGADVGADERP